MKHTTGDMVLAFATGFFVALVVAVVLPAL